MKCLFNCNKEIQTHSLPLCKEHLRGFGLKLAMFENEALEQKPKGVGPFFVADTDPEVPTLTFRVTGVNLTAQVRSIRLPTFRKNDVIVHCLSFHTLTGVNKACGNISAISVEELEKMMDQPSEDREKLRNVIRAQVSSAEYLKAEPPAQPRASRPLLRLFQEYPEVLTTNVFKNASVTDESVHEDTRVPFTVSWVINMTNLMKKYKDFDNRATIYYSLVYHLFPNRVKIGDEGTTNYMEMEPNVELREGVGLLALGDIFPGGVLILKDKEIDLQSLLCYLVAPEEEVIPNL